MKGGVPNCGGGLDRLGHFQPDRMRTTLIKLCSFFSWASSGLVRHFVPLNVVSHRPWPRASCSDRRPATSPTPIWVKSAARAHAWRLALAASISLSVRRRPGTMSLRNSRPDGGRTWLRCG